jgi:hypothetical protein
MSKPFTEWPDQVAFSGPELDVILGALEHALVLATADSTARRTVRRAQLVIWRRLWPELADQYEGPGLEEEE